MTRVPQARSLSSAETCGCPNRFPAPTLIRLHSGRQAASISDETPFSLPWCATLSTSMSTGVNPSCTPVSASPVRRAWKPPRSTRSTTLVSLAFASIIGPSGQRTRTVDAPILHDMPA